MGAMNDKTTVARRHRHLHRARINALWARMGRHQASPKDPLPNAKPRLAQAGPFAEWPGRITPPSGG